MLAASLLLLCLSCVPAQRPAPMGAAIKMVKGLLGQCDCPCRTYTTRRCVHTYEERCEPVGYDDLKCTKHPAVVAKYVKETECQRCQEFSEVGMTERAKLKCNQVYDESCSTVYLPTCNYERKCTVKFTKDCSQAEYGGPCHNVPVEQCKKLKKCHRTPQTRCKPASRMECGMDNILVPRKTKKQKCLPFGPQPSPESSCGEVQSHLPPSFPQVPPIYALVPSVDAPHGRDNQVEGLLGTSPEDTAQQFYSIPPTVQDYTPPTIPHSIPHTSQDYIPPTAKDHTPPTIQDYTPPTTKDYTPPTGQDYQPSPQHSPPSYTPAQSPPYSAPSTPPPTYAMVEAIHPPTGYGQEVTPILGDSIVDSFGGQGKDFQAHYEHGLQEGYNAPPTATYAAYLDDFTSYGQLSREDQEAMSTILAERRTLPGPGGELGDIVASSSHLSSRLSSPPSSYFPSPASSYQPSTSLYSVNYVQPNVSSAPSSPFSSSSSFSSPSSFSSSSLSSEFNPSRPGPVFSSRIGERD